MGPLEIVKTIELVSAPEYDLYPLRPYRLKCSTFVVVSSKLANSFAFPVTDAVGPSTFAIDPGSERLGSLPG